MYISAALKPRRSARRLGAPFNIPFATAADAATAGAVPPWWTTLFPPAAFAYSVQPLTNIIFGQNPSVDPLVGVTASNYAGDLSPNQVAQIQQNMNQGIVQAAPGNPDLQAQMEAQGATDIGDASAGSVLNPWWIWGGLALGVLVVVKALK